MITVPTIRNIVCPISIPPAAFPIQEFQQRLELGSIEQQIQIPEYALWEYQHVRLQVLPDRLQLGIRESASGSLARMAAEEFVRIAREEFKTRDVGFNANLRINPDDGSDPTRKIFDAKAAADRIGGTDPRGGVWLVYHGEDGSYWWLECVPDPNEAPWWIFSVQRRLESFPEGDAEQDAVFDWFEHSEKRLLEQCLKLIDEE